MQKRALLINDLSGVGRCSLTVAIPIISALGIETSVIPTAVLSTHTGGFEGYTFHDLTENMLPMAQHWHKLNLHFDAIYCGYLGSERQIEIVKKIISLLKSDDTVIIVDPVMADFGELYDNFKPDFPEKLKPLCDIADIIVPNITEACLLTNTPYEHDHTTDFATRLLHNLKSCVNAENIVLTGVCDGHNKVGAGCCSQGKTEFKFAQQVKGAYYGSGDVFCSAMCAKLLQSGDFLQSVQTAVEFTSKCIKRTLDAGVDTRYGVIFEPEIKNLL